MTKFYKHIGKCKNSGRRCVVVKDRIPGDESKALIVDIDALPDAYQHFLMDLVQSDAAQRTNELGEILARYQSPDSGYTMLSSLHNRQYMCAMQISNILMYPAPNYPIELSKVIELVDGGDVEKAKKDYSNDTLHNTVNSLKADDFEKNERVARNLIMEAERLKFESQKKFDEAYAIAPHLNNTALPTQTNPYRNQPVQDTYNTTPIPYSNIEESWSAPRRNENITGVDISDKIGIAPPPIRPVLTPEQEMLLRVSNPNYVPEEPIIEETIVVTEEVEKKAAPKRKRATRKTKTA